MKQQTIIKEQIPSKIISFEKSNELFMLLGLKGTLQLIYHLTEQPRQYKDIEDNSDLPKTTLVRRIESLQRYKIISKDPVTVKGRKTHVYSLTSLGLQLMNFSKRYERLSSIPREQKKIPIESEIKIK